MTQRIGIIGFGEAAQTFTGSPNWSGISAGYDLKLSPTKSDTALEQRFEERGVKPCYTNREASAEASVVLSLVTADQALLAAKETARSLSNKALFLDMNSVAPEKKRASASEINGAGARYVDVAIMAPVQPAILNVPLLLSGEHASDASDELSRMGFSNIRIVGPQIGQASAIKMVRSVMIKGIEALTAECLLAADAAGVTNEVLTALGGDWPERADYNLERMLVHGDRRAAEMEEVCATLDSLGIDPLLTRGTVARQRTLGQIGLGAAPDTLKDKLALIQSGNKVHAA